MFFQTEHLKDTPAIKELRDALDKLANDFKTSHPGLNQEFTEQTTKINESVEKIKKMVQTLENSEESKQVKETADKLIESAKQQLTAITKEFQAKAKAN